MPLVLDIGDLFDAHAPYLLRVAERLTGSAATAEDIIQEVFLVAWRRRAELSDDGQLRGWLYQVVVNQVRHHQRASARLHRFLTEYPPPSVEQTPEGTLHRRQQAKQIRRCVLRLPMPQREVFVLYELEELEGAAIAEILNIPLSTVWSRLRLARARFQRTWERS